MPTILITHHTYTIEEVHGIVYSAAYTTLTLNNQDIHQTKKCKPKIPRWQIRLQDNIERLRQNIGRLTQYINGNRSQKLAKEIQVHTENNNSIDTLNILLDTWKQKQAVYSTRLRRYKEASDRRQNSVFQNNERKFYNNFKPKQGAITHPPKKEDLTAFWDNLWNSKRTHNDDASWIEIEKKQYAHIDTAQDMTITKKDLEEAIKKTHSWKAPGVDGIHNFW